MFPHLSTCSRPTRHRTRVFLGVREHDLPTFPVPIRIVVSTRFHLFPCPFGNVSTLFHIFAPFPSRLAPLLCLSGRPVVRVPDFLVSYLNRCFLTFPLVPACFHTLRHQSTPFDCFTAYWGRFATGPSFGPFSPLSRCFHMFPLVPARLDTFPHHSIPLRRFPADLPRF